PRLRLCGAFCKTVRSWLAYQSQRHITPSATEKVKLTACPVKSSCDDRSQAQRTFRFFIGERKGVIERREQTRRVSNVLEFMQKVMNMPRYAAGRVTMTNAIREDHAGEIVAARKYGREIAAFVPS